MRRVKEKKEQNRTKDADRSDERKTDNRSSLDRLTDFARRILSVPKSEIDAEANRR